MLKLLKITSLLFLWNMSRNKRVMKLIFYIHISMKCFFKLIQWLLIGMDKHSQNSQKSKFGISLQYLLKEVRHEVDFLHADKRQSFLQVILKTWVLKFPKRWYYHYWWAWSSFLKLLKVTSLQYIYNVSKRSNGWSSLFAWR